MGCFSSKPKQPPPGDPRASGGATLLKDKTSDQAPTDREPQTPTKDNVAATADSGQEAGGGATGEPQQGSGSGEAAFSPKDGSGSPSTPGPAGDGGGGTSAQGQSPSSPRTGPSGRAPSTATSASQNRKKRIGTPGPGTPGPGTALARRGEDGVVPTGIVAERRAQFGDGDGADEGTEGSGLLDFFSLAWRRNPYLSW